MSYDEEKMEIDLEKVKRIRMTIYHKELINQSRINPKKDSEMAEELVQVIKNVVGKGGGK